MNKLVLVVDDQESILKIVKVILESCGYDVALAYDGTQLCNQLERRKPDLIVLDISLKYEFGGDLAKQLKKNDQTKDIPIMFFSGDAHIKKIAHDSHVDDYLEKPFDSRDLVNKVSHLIS